MVEIKEGTTSLCVPKFEGDKFPPPKDGVFFNPEMESNRDLTVLISDVIGPKKYLDTHSATGARGVRVANENEGIEVHLNDWSKEAVTFMEKNKEKNNLINIYLHNRDARCFLFEKKFDFIDLDPFGSPVPFLGPGTNSLINNGVLGCTATDTAPLCGSHIKAGIRKYGARSLRTPYHKEIGIRILLKKFLVL